MGGRLGEAPHSLVPPSSSAVVMALGEMDNGWAGFW